jgi:adenylate cyclase
MGNAGRPSQLTLRESVPSLERRRPLLRPLYRALDAHDVTGDRTEARMLRRLQLAMALASMPIIGGYGLLFGSGGHWREAAWNFAYVAATALLVVLLAITGKFAVLRIPHPLLVMMLPVALSIDLGGFENAGGGMLWTLLVPIAATMFALPYRTLWFLLVVAAAVVVYALRAPERGVLSPDELNFHFAFNTIGFTGFLYASVRYFVSRIDAEKARAEGLLHQVLPGPIVRRLKRGQHIADHHDAVTVVFADIVGFTPLAAKLSPAELVELLDAIFTAFDAAAVEHGVEKIKTIGDAYMAVAGAPEPCADHAARAAKLALAMRDHVAAIAKQRGIELAMRIGVHTGEVVAGVIGIQRFAYDLWGDTVNTASRMESHGQPGQVQITGATRDALGAAFTTRERGPIEVKGRGTITTYWLDGYSTAPTVQVEPRGIPS